MKEAKTKVKDALDNIHLPKMPKMHKPGFMKKKTKDEGEKAEDKTEDGNKEEVNKEEESKEEKTEENKEEPKEGEKEEKKEGSEEEKKDGEKAEEKKTSIILRIKSQVFPSKSKKEDTAESGEKPEEAEKLLEKKQRFAKELAEALKKGLEKLVEQGMIPAASIDKGEAADSYRKR